MSAALISCRDLHRHYLLGGEEIKALNGISVDIQPGEFVAVMGPSGSGKSTFMNMCGALDKPTSGTLSIAGRELNDLTKDELASLRNETVGFVFQQFNLMSRTTALDNVKLPLLYSTSPPGTADDRAHAALAQVGLSDRAMHKPNELSGGQQQRVAIARALVNAPKVILADEPTGALDSETSREVLELFQDLNSAGLTIVVVTHDADVASYAGRRIHFLDGKIVEDARQTPAMEVS